jgi:pimeloyl-ACP methyl ester carboxylesterase
VDTRSQAPGPPPPPGRTVSANGLRVYYEEAGDGPPLILLHGGTATGRMWQPQIPAFAGQFRVLTPDSRGHGRTDNPAGALSYRVMADDLAAFASAVGAHRPLLYGYSDGGQIALEVGMRHPDLARALVVGGAVFRFTDPYLAWVRAFLGGGDTADVDTVQLERAHPDYVAFLRTAHGTGAGGDDAWKTVLRQCKALWLTPLHYTPADFQRITAPTLVLVGDRDELVPVEEAAAMYRLLPTTELAVLPHAGHEPALGTAGVMTAAVLDFLGRHRQVGGPT